jgi:hypothetical protein
MVKKGVNATHTPIKNEILSLLTFEDVRGHVGSLYCVF